MRTRVLAVSLAVLAAAATVAQEPDVLEKPSKPGEGRKLDASGLTRTFDTIKRMTMSIAEREIGGGKVEFLISRLPTASPDYHALTTLESGVMQLQTSAPIKLRTEVDLKFADVMVAAGNVAPDYPGLYSLWLQKAGDDDWRLIFNHEADAWGTMHDPAKDHGEVTLDHQMKSGAKSPMTVKLDEAESGCRLDIAWGEHSWSVSFSAAG